MKHTTVTSTALIGLLLSCQHLNAASANRAACGARPRSVSHFKNASTLDSFFAQALAHHPFANTAPAAASQMTAAAPQTAPRHVSYDVVESDTAFTLYLDFPGSSSEDVKVTLEEGSEVLSIEGRRPAQGAKPAGPLMLSKIGLTRDIDTSRIAASMKNGVLAVTLPKTEKPKAVEIPIQMEEAPQQRQQQQQQQQQLSSDDNEPKAEEGTRGSWRWEIEERVESSPAAVSEPPSPEAIENTHISIAAP